MKSVLMILLALSSMAQANETVVEHVLKDTTTLVAVDLTPTTVFCTARGYSMAQLKISLPDLDWLAHFDHRVVGEIQPCITGGACPDLIGPGEIIDTKEPTTLIPVRVLLTEVINIDNENKTCSRTLKEHVTSLVRGHIFTHDKSGPQVGLSEAKCSLLGQIH